MQCQILSGFTCTAAKFWLCKFKAKTLLQNGNISQRSFSLHLYNKKDHMGNFTIRKDQPAPKGSLEGSFLPDLNCYF